MAYSGLTANTYHHCLKIQRLLWTCAAKPEGPELMSDAFTAMLTAADLQYINIIPRPGTPLGSALACQPTGPGFKPGLRQCFFKREQVCGQPEIWGSNLRAKWLSKISDGCVNGQAHP